MKVTRLGPPRPILNSGFGGSGTGSIPGGGSFAQVLTSNGSNGRYWGENVRRITSNGSNILLQPDVNFASGSGVLFAVASNTLTISATGGGGSSSLTTKDEGSTLSTAVTTLDFVGAGVVASGGGATTTVTIAGGGGGSSGYDLDTYSLDATYSDDFTAGSLSGLWTRRNFTSGAETYQLGKNATYIRIASAGRAAGDGYLFTAPGGDWTFAMAGVYRDWGNRMPWGIAVINSVGTGLGTCFYDSPMGFLVAGITTYTSYSGSFQQLPSFTTAYFGYQHKIWQYLRKSGTNYYAAMSLDGEIWSPETPAFSSAITVDRVGMLINPLNTISTNFADVDWFNKIA